MPYNYTRESKEADFIETWNPGTQRYEGRRFNPNDSHDQERLRSEQQAARNRAGNSGSSGQPPYLHKRRSE